MALGARVRFYREYRRWTLEDLAERSGVDVGTISALENRNSKRSNFAQPLAGAFGLSIEQLIDDSRNWLSEGLSAGRAAKFAAQEPPSPQYIRWPFADITVTEWQSLSIEDRAQVQGFARALLSRRKRRVA